MFFIFHICFISLCSCWCYEFCSRIKTCAITAEIKKYKSIIKKRKKHDCKKKHDEIELLGKPKLNNIKVVTSKSLIDSYITHSEFVSVNNVLREYNEMKDRNKHFSEKYCMKTLETTNKISSVRKAKQNRLMFLSNCAVCGRKKSTFIKNK